MTKFDLGLVDGNDWDAAAVNSVEAAINKCCIFGTNTERLAMTGQAPGQQFFDQANGRLWLWDGTGGDTQWVIMHEPPQTWSPTWSAGVTVGNGVWSNAKYQRENGFCNFEGRFTMGSTSAITGTPTLNLPFSLWEVELLMPIPIVDNGIARYVCFMSTFSPGAVALIVGSTGGAVSSTSPFTFGNGDYFTPRGRFKMASPFS